ncbi:unnamed protein product (macronuclear) [Paramecium tetraurelia]|uniref:60S ribosomal protein L6 n=1 Tax=Paramecium tetraurelia TaxID=5888 RepID=A0CXH8_PARTE|nr:uncharacterized protein GSPATT00011127001 [Paramecium tetraurelia]CAK75495.1 unnamed protein product [Paramecium tetraurelia]|eukprot:XP_001442892.1 hypothetical protein (macronuclear) [Paramecium tetraurelia strain d4-2]
MPAKKRTVRIGNWYKSDDEKVHFVRKRKAPRPAQLRKIVPGQVLILLSGRFQGKRVVFLKQLKSGLLLVTGPFKVNGVPLKRVNSAYVIPTSTKVDVTGVNANQIDDDYFKRTQAQRRKNEQGFWAKRGELTTEQQTAEKTRLDGKRNTQKSVDAALITAIKKTQLLKQYLGARFTIGKTTRPHELVF